MFILISGAICLYLTSRGSLLELIWLTLATIDTFRALRLVRPNGRKVGLSTRRKAMKEALTSWVVSVAISQLEPILTRLLGWLPFYAPLRWLVCVAFLFIRSSASATIYKSSLRPLLRKYETPIDLILLLFHSLAAIAVYHTITHPLHLIRTTISTISGILRSRPVVANLGSQAAPIVIDDTSDEEVIPIPQRAADISLSTPIVPGRLVGSARKDRARPISRAEVGESSRSAGRAAGTRTSGFLSPSFSTELEGASSTLSIPSHDSSSIALAPSSGSRIRKRQADDLDSSQPTPDSAARAKGRTRLKPSSTSAPAPPPAPARPSAPTSRAGPRSHRATAESQSRDASTAVGEGSTKQAAPAQTSLYPALPNLPTIPSSSSYLPLPTSLPSSSSATLPTAPAAPSAPRARFPKSSTSTTLSRHLSAIPGHRIPSALGLPPSRLARPIPRVRVLSDPNGSAQVSQSSQSTKTKSTAASGASSSSGGSRDGLSQLINRPRARLAPTAAVIPGKGKGVTEQDATTAEEMTADRDKGKEKDGKIGRKRSAPDTQALDRVDGMERKRLKRNVGDVNRRRVREDKPVGGAVAGKAAEGGAEISGRTTRSGRTG